MEDGCGFVRKNDIYKESSCHDSNHRNLLTPENESETDVSEVHPIIADKNDMSMDKEISTKQTSSLVVSPDFYKTLLDNIYTTRLLFLRARNITTNQFNVYKEEAIEHMGELKRIIQEELENPEASTESLAQELVEAGTEVIRNQQALNRIEMEELVKNLDSLLNIIRSDVKEAKSLAELEYQEESEPSSYTDFIFDYGHWCLFVLCVSIVLGMGLFRLLPAFEEYL